MSGLPADPTPTEREAEFNRLLLEHRRGLKAFVLTVVQDHHLAEDILQETAVVVAAKWEETEIRDFWSYSREVARRQALKAVRTRGRQPATLSDEALDALNAAFDELGKDPGGDDQRLAALQACLDELPGKWLQILDLRYWRREKVTAIALRLRTQANVVSVTINRAKSRLATCVSAKLRERTA